MSPKSPKEDNPARCITKELDEESNSFSCDAADKQITRLCVCTKENSKVEASSTSSTLVQEENTSNNQGDHAAHNNVPSAQGDNAERKKSRF